ncbi:DNA topoisomerase III [Gemella morbillorum M424]|uniref:DNA topoisomerase n=1 Tax=Gemella morbillorum TaxID=29391 RepID=A0AAP9HCZ3_9BACL|nr:DNA topoisomerase III [Gemella morbillorum]EFV36196.1 DNA topoisomerase III [Gemella morbillorum M424]QGS09495.1 DNA topoisomerase III [Gemella morbillorum]
MKSVVLCEKPSVARDIARNLGAKNNKNGCLEGDKYIVTWALGHLVTLQTPDKYKEFSNVSLENLPMIPKYMKTEIIKKTFKQYKIIETAVNRKDVNEVIIATDAGREGELVARYILEKANCKKKVKRLWISSVTDKAIKDGFKNLKAGDDYLGLYYSGVARANADWLVGINASRALTLKYNASLNCGRVQTPTLQMVFEREEKIKNFKPREYYTFEAVVDGIRFNCGESEYNFTNAEKFVSDNKNKTINFDKVEVKIKTSIPKPLYNLTDIQQAASALFGLSPKQTLNIIQRLYESHKVLTYPRTDSRYLTTDMKNTLADRLRAIGGDYKEITAKLLREKDFNTKRIINNSKVSDHHAIIPTEQKPNYMSLSDTELKIYNLVVTRFLENLLPDYKYEETSYSFKLDNKVFTAKSTKVIQLGFKELSRSEIEDKKISFSTKEFSLDSLQYNKKQTTPPSYYTEGSLIYAMENPFEFVDDDNERKILKQTNGIGTVATRADILEKLFTNDYLVLDNGRIKTTNKAKQLLNLVPKNLKSPSLTATWEKQLDNIAKNKLSKDKFLKDIKDYTRECILEIKDSQDKFKHDNISGKKCEECGNYMLEVDKKGTKMLKCSSPTCRNRKVISRLTNLRCDNCHKKMTLFGSGENSTYRCVCGNSLKQKEVDKRIKNNKKDKASRVDMKKYMKQESLENNALRDKLLGLKLK